VKWLEKEGKYFVPGNKDTVPEGSIICDIELEKKKKGDGYKYILSESEHAKIMKTEKELDDKLKEEEKRVEEEKKLEKKKIKKKK